MVTTLRSIALLAAAALFTTSQAQVVFDFDADGQTLLGVPGTSSNESTDGDIAETKTATKDGVSITVTESGAKNPNRLWYATPKLRMYGGTMSIAAEAGITKVVFKLNTQPSNAKWNATADTGEVDYTAKSSITAIWTGDAKSIVLSVAGNTQVSSIAVYRPTDVVSFSSETVETLAALGADKDNVEVTFDNAAVAYVDGKDAHVRQGSKAVILRNTSLTLKSGDVVNGKMRFNFENYAGIPRLNESEHSDAAGVSVAAGAAVQPVEVAVADLVKFAMAGDYVVVKGVKVTSEVSGKYTNYYAVDADGNSIQLYGNNAVVQGLAGDGNSYDITALFNNSYKGTPEIEPVAATVTAGIASVGAAGKQAVAYDLSGRLVAPGSKGIVVYKGKKLLNK